MSSFNSYIYNFFRAGVEGLVMIPTLVLAIIGYASLRRGKDPARGAFSLLPTTMAVYFIAFGVSAAAAGLTGYEGAIISQPNRYLTTLATFFHRIGSALLLYTLSELATGVHYATSQTVAKSGRIIFGGIATLVSVLALVVFSRYLKYWADFYNGRVTLSSSTSLRTFSVLSSVGAIFLFVGSLALFAFAVGAAAKSNGRPSLNLVGDMRNPRVYLIVAATMFAFARTWALIPAIWNIQSKVVPFWWPVVEGVMYSWTSFVIMVLVFALGAKKAKGLWTTQQRWMVVQPQQMMYAAPAYHTAPYPPQQSQGWHVPEMAGQPQYHQYAPAYPAPQVWHQPPHYQHTPELDPSAQRYEVSAQTPHPPHVELSK